MAQPDPFLTDTDRRILQWQREGRPDAEIAVRIGLTVGETKERIQKLKRKLDEEDAELSRWRRPEPGQEPVIDFAPPLSESDPSGPPTGKTYSRRAVIGAGLAGLGVSAAAAAGGFTLFGRGDDNSAAGADDTPTAAASGTPPPTPTPHPGLSAIVRDDSAWSRTILPDRGEIPYDSGAGFIDASTGEIDVMRLTAVPREWAWGGSYRASPSGRFVAGEASGPEPVAAGLLDRETGQGWSWDQAALRLIYLGDQYFAFAELARDPTYSGNRFGNGVVHIVRNDFSPAASGNIGPDTAGAVQIAGPGAESNLFVVMYGQYRPFIFDLDTGTMAEGETLPDGQRVRSVATQSPPGVVSVISTRDEGDHTTFIRSDYDAAGRAIRHVGLDERAADLDWPARNHSPDGRWLVRQDAIRDTTFALGDNEVWSYVEVQDAESDRASFRILSGQLIGANPWLADSSAFVIESGRPGVEYANYNDFRHDRAYYLVDPSTASLEQLDDVPGDLNFSPFFPAVIPSLEDPDLIAFGGMIIHNRRTGAWFGPSNATFTFGGQWTEGSRELQFQFPPGGRDGAGSGTILPPYIEEPPFRTDVTLQIARAGTCVNLRSGPSQDADVLDCLADGALLTALSPEEPLPNEDAHGSFVRDRPAFWSADADERYDPETYQMYVHVRTQSGATGWVAIQYLDWAP